MPDLSENTLIETKYNFLASFTVQIVQAFILLPASSYIKSLRREEILTTPTHPIAVIKITLSLFLILEETNHLD